VSEPSIHPGAFVDPAARLGPGVVVGPGAVIGPHVRIGDGTHVGSHAMVSGWTRVGRDCRIHHGAAVGGPPQDLKYTGAPSYLEVGDRTEIREFATLHLATEPGATTRVGSDCLLMAYSHIAHNCHVGNRVIIANGVQLAGYVTIEDWAILGGVTIVHQFARIGCHSMVGGGSRISQDVAPYIKLAGSPPRLIGLNVIGLERRGFAAEARTALDRSYRLLFRDARPVTEAVARMRSEFAGCPEVEHLARFAETTVRGLTR
jgi:UDP-N-acetylglucosamine acyltransferase